jgi:hypothetical protein
MPEIPKNPNIPPKRARTWTVFYLTEPDHAMVQQLGAATGHVDHYDALVDLEQVVQQMTEGDLDDFPKRRAIKVGIPLGLNAAIRAKAAEWDCTYVKVFLSAVQKRVIKHQTAKRPKRKRTAKQREADQSEFGGLADSGAKTPNGGLADSGAKTSNGGLAE